jgi:hypothetical protein
LRKRRACDGAVRASLGTAWQESRHWQARVPRHMGEAVLAHVSDAGRAFHAFSEAVRHCQ